MANAKISEYSSTASSNTTLDGIALGESVMVPSDVNDALRELMAHLADMNAGTSSIQDTFTLSDPADDTKKVRIDAGSVTTGNTRVLTAPDANTTIAGLGIAQTFTAAQRGATQTAGSITGATTLDFATYQNFVLTLTGNTTLSNPTTEKVGQSGFISITQTGGYTLSLGTDYETAGGAGITLSASGTDLIPYLVIASGRILLGTPQLAFA